MFIIEFQQNGLIFINTIVIAKGTTLVHVNVVNTAP